MSESSRVHDAEATDSVPQASTTARGVESEGLPIAARTVWRIESAVGAGLASAISLIVFALWPSLGRGQAVEFVVLGFIVVAFLLDLFVLIPRRYKRYAFDLAGPYVSISRGALIETQTIIPTDKILYVQVNRGPITRALGLAKVKLGTLGEPISLGPLDTRRAEQMQLELSFNNDAPRNGAVNEAI